MHCITNVISFNCSLFDVTTPPNNASRVRAVQGEYVRRNPEDDRLHSGTFSSFTSAIKRKEKKRIRPRRRVYSTIYLTIKQLSTMKFLWAVSALLLGCWRANASTGTSCVSAMLV